MTTPINNGLELIVELNKLSGDDWKEHQYTYMNCGDYYTREENAILKKYGYERDSAPFIVRVHHVEYIPTGADYWQVAHIIKDAILDKDFDMNSFIKENYDRFYHNGLENGHYDYMGGRLGSNKWVIQQEK